MSAFFWGVLVGIFIGGTAAFVCFALLAMSDDDDSGGRE
jgi:hypothetical protein